MESKAKINIMFYIGSLGNGGAERVITNLANYFADKYNVILLTSYRASWEYSLDDKVKRLSIDDNLPSLRSKIIKNIMHIREIKRIIKKEKISLSVSFMGEPNIRNIFANLFSKAKTIISVRTDPSREYPGFFGKLERKWLLGLADGCVLQTNDAKTYFSKKIQKKSVIIMNSVKNSFFHVEHHPEIGKMVTCGRLTEKKNHEQLIRVFAKVKNAFPFAKLYIYGDGPLKEKLSGLIETAGLVDSVFLMGQTDNVADVLSSADLFLLPSKYEGMPNALLEAMAVGVPCISTDCPCGGPSMVIENGVNGILIPVDSDDALYNSIESLLSNRTKMSSIGKRAKETSIAFSPTAINKIWADYFVKILNN